MIHQAVFKYLSMCINNYPRKKAMNLRGIREDMRVVGRKKVVM